MTAIPPGAVQAAAREPCEHYWASHCYGGLSVRLCQLCHEPDWGDLRGQLAEAERKGTLAERERCAQLAEEHGAHYGCYVSIGDTVTSGLRPAAALLRDQPPATEGTTDGP